jgi:uncharacterized protein involved in response to NO
MFRHALWLVGFRPFFTLAFLSGALLPLVWALAYQGRLILPIAPLAPFQWHAYEMLYGFGWAVLGGFLLTASKNWVSIRGMHGGALAFAVLLWLVERGALFLPPTGVPGVLRWVFLNAFGAYIIGYLLWTLVRHRRQDTFPDNAYFIVALPFFMAARNLMLLPEYWIVGTALTVGIFRLAFAVMFERTMTQFMKNAMGVTLPRYRWLDLAIKSTVLFAAFEGFMPPLVATVVLGTAAILLFARLLTWKPLVGLRTFGIGIMYAGYTGLVVHLALSAAQYAGLVSPLGSVSLHVFFFLCMGLIIPAMLIRICQGHTGRKLRFTLSDKVALGAMGVGAFFRLVAPQLWPVRYADWITLAAVGWSVCFVLIGVRLTPYLWQERVDAREH